MGSARNLANTLYLQAEAEQRGQDFKNVLSGSGGGVKSGRGRPRTINPPDDAEKALEADLEALEEEFREDEGERGRGLENARVIEKV